jgi:hypothetical protein
MSKLKCDMHGDDPSIIFKYYNNIHSIWNEQCMAEMTKICLSQHIFQKLDVTYWHFKDWISSKLYTRSQFGPHRKRVTSQLHSSTDEIYLGKK